MFSQDNYWVSLCLAIITMITWGSNKIAVKYLTYPVAMYTIDYFTWVFIFHIILGFTMGAEWFPPMKGVGMISNLKEIIANSDVRNMIINIICRGRFSSSSLVVPCWLVSVLLPSVWLCLSLLTVMDWLVPFLCFSDLQCFLECLLHITLSPREDPFTSSPELLSSLWLWLWTPLPLRR